MPESKPNPADLVRRAISLSRRCAENGRPDAARRAWNVAAWYATRCGAISGSSWVGDGYAAIVVDGRVSVSPVPLIERRAAA